MSGDFERYRLIATVEKDRVANLRLRDPSGRYNLAHL
jgi:hypothetical protein